MGRLVALAAPFAVMPELLRYLGAESFGVWMTAVSITSAALFLDLGVGNSLLTKLGVSFGREDYISARGYILGAYNILIKITVALLLLVLLVVVLCVNDVLNFGVTPLGNHDLYIIAICMAAFLVGVPASLIQKILYARQMVLQCNLWQILGAICSVISCYVAIWMSFSSWAVVLAYSLPPVLVMIVATFVFFSSNPALFPDRHDASPILFGELFGLGKRFLCLAVITSVGLNIDNTIIAATLGSESVTEFSVPIKLASLLGLLVTTMFLPLWPANADALVRNDYDWVRRSTIKMSTLGFGLVAAVGIVLVVVSNSLVEMWMGRSFENQGVVLAGQCCLFVLMAFTSPFNMLLNSLSRVRIQIVAWFLFLISTISVKLWLVPVVGFWIIPIVTSAGYMVFIMPLVVYGTRDVLHIKSSNSKP